MINSALQRLWISFDRSNQYGCISINPNDKISPTHTHTHPHTKLLHINGNTFPVRLQILDGKHSIPQWENEALHNLLGSNKNLQAHPWIQLWGEKS